MSRYLVTGGWSPSRPDLTAIVEDAWAFARKLHTERSEQAQRSPRAQG
ncbi:hypothetical protein ABZV60_08185 [Streptomyces sp. NPDC004787]